MNLMHMARQQIEETVLAAYPAPFRRRLAQSVFVAWRTEWEKADAGYDANRRDSVFWWGRRAKIEELVEGAAELVPGLEASTQQIPHSPLNYTTVYGGRCKLLVKKVDKPGAMVEEADYRTELAAENPQLSLFEALNPAPAPTPTLEAEGDGPGLLVFATYSGYVRSPEDTERYPYLPGSLYFACPDDKGSAYLWEHNIFEEFPDVVRANVPDTWDNEAMLRFLHHSQSATYRFGGGA